MIKVAGSEFDDYSISSKIGQILLHWGYELTEKDFYIDLTNKCIKMSYYWFNWKEIMQKVKERYSKEKTVVYYLQNKEEMLELIRKNFIKLSNQFI